MLPLEDLFLYKYKSKQESGGLKQTTSRNLSRRRLYCDLNTDATDKNSIH